VYRHISHDFKVVLHEDAQEVLALVLANRCRSTRPGIETSAFVVRSIIQEVPHVKEVVAGHAAPGAILKIEQPRDVSTELEGVASDDLGGNILEAVGPLIQYAADVRPKRDSGDAAHAVDAIGRQSNGRLR